jgi:outer membrane biosynthesis protein TonB
MKFSTIAVLLIAAPASSFVPLKNKVFTRSQSLFAIEDLEAKLFAPPAPSSKVDAKAVKAKPKPIEKPKAVEKPKPLPKVKPEPAPKPAPKIEVKKEPVKVQATKKAAIVVEKPKPIPVVKDVAPPKKPVESDPNAGPLGVALGSAPLILAPLVALSAGRDILAKTAARRAEIEAEIKAAEAAKAKKLTKVEVDKAGLAKAGVSKIVNRLS